ncbi:putative spindle assembly checkpoint kinase-like protein [Diplonema papillatum]|nr:putative spindle assembly checkpoint kinase-like protein [Diplonema papillatum]
MSAAKRVYTVRRDASGLPVQKRVVELEDDRPLPTVTGIEQLELVEEIGRTNMAVVYKARERETGRIVAVKMLDKLALLDMTAEAAAAAKRCWKTETTVHLRLKHPFIVRLHSVFEDAEYKYLVLEYCEHGDMAHYFHRTIGQLPEATVAFYVRQVALALAYLHKHSPVVIHRDLKLENCLIDSNRNVKLADFGSAGVLLTPQERRGTLCGTLDYLAPEFLGGKLQGEKADVWALGVLAYEMTFGHTPFAEYEDQQDLIAAIAHVDVELPDRRLSPECTDFFKRILVRDEAQRPTSRRGESSVQP